MRLALTDGLTIDSFSLPALFSSQLNHLLLFLPVSLSKIRRFSYYPWARNWYRSDVINTSEPTIYEAYLHPSPRPLHIPSHTARAYRSSHVDGIRAIAPAVAGREPNHLEIRDPVERAVFPLLPT